jgi:hypothetical protein
VPPILPTLAARSSNTDVWPAISVIRPPHRVYAPHRLPKKRYGPGLPHAFVPLALLRVFVPRKAADLPAEVEAS